MASKRRILGSMALAGISSLGWSQDTAAQIKAKVSQVQQAIRNAGASWQAGDNPMMHLTAQQKRARVMTARPPSPSRVLYPGVTPLTSVPALALTAPLRPALDWRNEGGKNYVTPVKDQGDCGACWVFASMSTLESQWAIKHGRSNPTLDLSEQNALSCLRPSPQTICNGGSPFEVFQFAQATGVVEESCFPYMGTLFVPCSSQCSSPTRRVRKLVDYQMLPDSTDLWGKVDMVKRALAHGPVNVDFLVYEDFYDYVGGIYQHVCGDCLGAHSVTLVGYDDNYDCWIAKNSWGTGWGDGGFFMISYENDVDFPSGDMVGNLQLNYDWIKVSNDFDGNGDSDLLWRNSQTGQVSVQAVNHGIPAAPQVIHTEADPAWKLVGTGDFDGDGHGDLLWWNSTTGQVYQMLMDVDAAGASVIRSQGVIYTEADTSWKLVGIADFTADGRSDLLWRHATNGSVYVMPLMGNTVLPGSLLYTEPDATWEIVSTGDRDGDGRADLLWRNSATGQIFQMMIDSSGSSVSIESMDLLYTGMDANWKIVATGDFNGDGYADVIWRCTNGGAIYVMFMRGDTILPSSDQLTIEPNPDTVIAAVGDYDGDGKSDLLWWNNTTGQVYRMLLDGRTIKSDTLIHTAPSSAWKLLK